jgi:hypothetical protein
MAELSKLTQNWVEVREEGEAGTIVLRPLDHDVPRSRASRRRLMLAPAGKARALEAGPTDAIEEKAGGGWSVDGDVLHLDLPGWQGDYAIERNDDDILVLRPR